MISCLHLKIQEKEHLGLFRTYSIHMYLLYLWLTICPVKGTSTRTWRRCWGTWPAAGRRLSVGWSGSLMNRPGTHTSTLSCATRKWTKLAAFMSDISFCWCYGGRVHGKYNMAVRGDSGNKDCTEKVTKMRHKTAKLIHNDYYYGPPSKSVESEDMSLSKKHK